MTLSAYQTHVEVFSIICKSFNLKKKKKRWFQISEATVSVLFSFYWSEIISPKCRNINVTD